LGDIFRFSIVPISGLQILQYYIEKRQMLNNLYSWSAMDHYLFFSVGHIRCGIPFSDTVSMIRMVRINTEGRSGNGKTGTINLHGEILEVYSIRELFGYKERPPSLQTT